MFHLRTGMIKSTSPTLFNFCSYLHHYNGFFSKTGFIGPQFCDGKISTHKNADHSIFYLDIW